MNIKEHSFGELTWDITTDLQGKTITILGSIHGNEPCGAQAIEWLLEELKVHPILSGHLKLVIGNPKALAKNTRFIHVDMNRLYGGSIKGVDILEHWFELERIEEIKAAIKGSEILLDLHSGTTAMPPMTCNANSKEHIELASIFPIEFITTGWDGSTTGVGGDEYMDSQGGLGLTVECGQHNSDSSFRVAKKAISSLLHHCGMWKHDRNVEHIGTPSHVAVTKTLYAEGDSFTFHLDCLDNFSVIPKGTHIATDWKREIYADKEYILLMPKPTPLRGQEACYLGVKIEV